MMKKNIIFWLMGFPLCLMAQVEFSGFFDILYQREVSSSDNLGFNYGQFEVDISSTVSDYVHVEGALAYNPDEEKVELGAGFIDFHLLGSNEDHPIRGNFLTHSGIMLGQFDVPFGIDYLSIPSPDRELVSVPLLNEMTINSWNDFGLNVYGVSKNFNFTFFAVNGFNGGVALGARTGFVMIPNTEFGFSYMSDLESLAVSHNRVIGVDLRSKVSSSEIKVEYQLSEGVYCGEQDLSNSNRKHGGYYVQYLKDLENWLKSPLFVVVRYGAWSSHFDKDGSGSNDYQDRGTVSVGYRVSEVVELRMEYLSNQIEKDNVLTQFTLQSVVTF